MTRKCGNCEACCSMLSIPVMGKLPWTPCPHQTGGGCKVYPRHGETDARPCAKAETNRKRASDFMCLWLEGGLNTRHRPDHSGVVVRQTVHPILREGFDVIECSEGAASRGLGHEISERLAKHWPIIIHAPDRYYYPGFIGPRRQERVRRFKGPASSGSKFRALAASMESSLG